MKYFNCNSQKTLISLSFIFVFFFASLSHEVNAQSSQYSIFGGYRDVKVTPLFYSKQGFLFGALHNSNRYMYSKDNGRTWAFFKHSMDLTKESYAFNYFMNTSFYSNYKREIFYTEANKVYRVDTLTFETTLLKEFEKGDDIQSIGFTDSGKIYVKNYRRLVKLDKNWNVEKMIFMVSSSGSVAIDRKDSLHICQSGSGTLFYVDDRLNIIRSQVFNDDIYNDWLYRNGKAVYFHDKISFDLGSTWKNWYSGARVVQGADDNFYAFPLNTVVKMRENGTFEVIQDIYTDDIPCASATGDIIYLVDSIVHYDAASQMITVFQPKSVKEFTSSIMEITDSTLLMNDHINEFNFFTKNLKRVECDIFNCYRDVKRIGQTTWIGANGGGNGTAISRDNRVSWELINPESFSSSYRLDYSFQAKNSAQFLSNDYTNILSSRDTFVTFDMLNVHVNPGSEYNKSTFCSSGAMVSRGGFVGEYSVAVNGFTSFQISEHEKIFNFETDYFEDIIYLVTRSHDSTFVYVTSLEKVLEKYYVGNLRGYDLRVLTDKYGQVIVYNQDMILISRDRCKTFKNITPNFPEFESITDVEITFNNQLWISTVGLGLVRYDDYTIDANKLQLQYFIDSNANCIYDSGEELISGDYHVLANNVKYQYKSDIAESDIITFNDSLVIKPLVDSDIFSLCQSSFAIQFSDTMRAQRLFVPLNKLIDCNALEVSLSTPIMRRCFDIIYHGKVTNIGTVNNGDGTLNLTFDKSIIFKSISLPVISQTDSSVVVKLGGLRVNEHLYFKALVNISCESSIGEEHCIKAEVVELETSCLKGKNVYEECRPNVGAFDPNDKMLFVNGRQNSLYFDQGDKIEYLIRFQNTGTDTAFNVRVTDIIDPSFDINSLKIIGSSHDYSYSIYGRNLEVLFNNILLVDSFKNEALSHGFFKFEISLDSTVLDGREVDNTAEIFFDFNEPIITNTVKTIVGFPSYSTDIKKDNKFTVVPNPNTGLFEIELEGHLISDDYFVSIFDMFGQIVYENISGGQIYDYGGILERGTYILKIVKENKVEGYTKVMILK
jgi:uncharacterized repeat protein (TIGR01451 family)